jgi:hypothetical protein
MELQGDGSRHGRAIPADESIAVISSVDNRRTMLGKQALQILVRRLGQEHGNTWTGRFKPPIIQQLPQSHPHIPTACARLRFNDLVA